MVWKPRTHVIVSLSKCLYLLFMLLPVSFGYKTMMAQQEGAPSSLTQLATLKVLPSFSWSPVRLALSENGRSRWFQLSPDGRYMLTTHYRQVPPEMVNVWSLAIYRSNGELMLDTADRFGHNIQASWSPDGRAIYVRIGWAQPEALRATGVRDGGEGVWKIHWPQHQRYYRIPGSHEVPLFSPDSTKYLTAEVIRSAKRGYSSEIFIHRANAETNRRRLALGTSPIWSPGGKWILYRGPWKQPIRGWYPQPFVICDPNGHERARFLGWEELLADNAEMWRQAKWVSTPEAGVAAWLYDGRILVGGNHTAIVVHDGEVREKTVPHLWLVDWQKGQRKVIDLPIELISGSLDGKHLLVKVEGEYYRLDFTLPEK